MFSPPWFYRVCANQVAVTAHEENNPGAKKRRDVFQPEEFNVELAEEEGVAEEDNTLEEEAKEG